MINLVGAGAHNDSWEAVRAVEAGRFVATEWDSVYEKRTFFSWLKRFMLNGCPKKMWSKKAYRHLNLHLFGHIAHYNQEGFWQTWFEKERSCHKWVDNIAERACYGSPTCTWSDVEVAIKNWLNEGQNRLMVHAAIEHRFGEVA